MNPDGAAADISPPDGTPFEHPSILSDGDVNMLPLEEDGMSDNGIGVTYADPNQIKERRRLMELLETKQKEPWDVEDEPQAVRPRPAGSKGGGRAKNVKKSGSRTAGGSRRGSRTTTS